MTEVYENFALTEGVRKRMEQISTQNDLMLLDLMITKINMNKLYDRLIDELSENRLTLTRDQAKHLDAKYKSTIKGIERITGKKVAIGRYIRFKSLVVKRHKCL